MFLNTFKVYFVILLKKKNNEVTIKFVIPRNKGSSLVAHQRLVILIAEFLAKILVPRDDNIAVVINLEVLELICSKIKTDTNPPKSF